MIEEMLKAKFILAPMAGNTDIPFRLIARKYGCRFAFTEMIDVNGIFHKNLKTLKMMSHPDEDSPLGVQIVGAEEEKILHAAKLCEDNGAKLIDLNSACPAHKVTRLGKGSALLKDLEKFKNIISCLTKNLKVPVTIKIRAGWDDNTKNCVTAAKIAEDEGARAITIHPRTQTQMYKGKPDHELTRAIKETVKIPVFASGNIFTPDDAFDVLKQTSCDGVFIARGSLGKPWIFRDIYSRAQNENIPAPDFTEKKKIILEHFELAVKYGNERRNIPRMYKHVSWYLKGFKNMNDIMKKYIQFKTYDSIIKFVETLEISQDEKLLF
ncbi:tRNA-dihydrouridine synthase B [Candidatus Omnitrophus magneticus]|uniref:tRNA-dihydrouridine synthase n=1 Tax=Candidatus Omnitrophus magneticus TaxID=1609969 RepID=A0A0F0CS44_9BACT|nr:tRNA-dihydrouridine synthase B [Candidatus Omnitrophus magneticus]